jgi:Tol biopolymer transport system component
MSIRTLALLLFIASAAGTAAAQDGPAKLFHQSLSWSPDGREIVFAGVHDVVVATDAYASDLYVVKVRNGKTRRLTDTDFEAASPSWGRGGRIVFAGEGRDRKSSGLYTISSEGGQPAALTPPANGDTAPALSPDGRRVAFMSTRDGGKYQLYVMNVDGSGARRLIDDPSRAYCNPQWSPDGRTLVFYTDMGDGLDQVWTIPVDGGTPKLLTGNLGHNIHPSWTADGARILFAASPGGGGSYIDDSMLVTMRSDGTDRRELAIRAFYARYSPDGLQLAYVGGPFPDNQLFVANSDGTDQKVVGD